MIVFCKYSTVNVFDVSFVDTDTPCYEVRNSTCMISHNEQHKKGEISLVLPQDMMPFILLMLSLQGVISEWEKAEAKKLYVVLSAKWYR